MAVAIVVAAGSGERLGASRPKAFVVLAGRPMVEWSLAALQAVPAVSQIVVVLPPGEAAPPGTLGVPGGAHRAQSVRAGVLAAAGGDPVIVHDAARPLVPAEVVDRVVAAVRAGAEAVIPTLGVVDTVKEVDGDGVVRATLDRSRLHAVQTPQGFDRDVLQRAHAASDGGDASDDAGMVERMGVTVRIVPGHEEAFKITRPLDLVLAEAILVRRRASGGVG